MTDFDGAVDAMMADDLAQPPPQEPFDAAVDQVTRRQQQSVRASLLSARDADPAEVARALRLSQVSGVPVEVVERNLPEVEAHTTLDYWDGVLKSAPATRGWLTDPINAQIARNDIEALTRTESMWRAIADVGRSLAGGLVADFLGSTLAGAGELMALANRAKDRPIDLLAPLWGSTAEEQAAMRAEADRRHPWFFQPSEIVRRPGEVLKGVGEAIKPPVERRDLSDDVASGVGQLAGQIATLIFSGGTSALLTGGMLLSSGADQIADRARRAGKYGTAEGDVATLLGASVTALTERMGLGLLLNRMTPQIRNAILGRLTDVAAAGGIETAQEAIEGVLHNVIEKALLDPDAKILEGLEREAAAAGGAGAVARAILAAIARGRQRTSGPTPADDAVERIQAFNALGDRVAVMQMAKQSPDKTEEAVGAIVAEGGPREVLVPAQKVREVLQTLPPDEAEKHARAWGVDTQLAADTTLVADVAIPTETYLAKVYPVAGEALGEDIRLDPNGLSLRQAKVFDETFERLLSPTSEQSNTGTETGASVAPSVKRLFDDVRRQMEEAGATQAQAKVIAGLQAADVAARTSTIENSDPARAQHIVAANGREASAPLKFEIPKGVEGEGQALPSAVPPPKIQSVASNPTTEPSKADGAPHPGDRGWLAGSSQYIGIGPYAGGSIPARLPKRDFRAQEKADNNRNGRATGCHSCGALVSGLKSGNFVLDHQPASAINLPGGRQRLYPHCIRCSVQQGVLIARALKMAGAF
jgi:hypothetical protein